MISFERVNLHEKEKYDAAVDLLSAALRFDLERPVSETKSK